MFDNFLTFDLPPLLAAWSVSVASALIGSYLLLRRQSLIGDAISHAVLPGIVITFILVGERLGVEVFIGAAISGIIAVIFGEILHRHFRIESSASLGVTFSIFFAGGIFLIEQSKSSGVDLDPACLLYGQLESIFWLGDSSLPREVWQGGITLLLVLIFIATSFKELNLLCFDRQGAELFGFKPRLLDLIFIAFVAVVVVAAFEVVGAILVIAMLVAPGASARFYTDKIRVQLNYSVLFASISTFIGYGAAVWGPSASGFTEVTLSASGMIATTSVGIVILSALFASPYGVIVKWRRALARRLQIEGEDLLAALYRAAEGTSELRIKVLPQAKRYLLRNGWATLSVNDNLELSPIGLKKAAYVVRSHRLWESYLVQEAGLLPTHVHSSAEKLEHFTSSELNLSLTESQKKNSPNESLDPHGRRIP